MRRTTSHNHLSLWTLMHLQHDLEEVAYKLDHLAHRLDEGRIDFATFEAVIEQIRHSRCQLDQALMKGASQS